MTTGPRVEDHYSSAGIARRILDALKAAGGPDAPVTPDSLAPLDHFHGRGIQATRELVELLRPAAGEEILDIGSGIGGPARWIAWTFGCRVTGVDLTPAFCEAARELNRATGMDDRVRILEGNALALPLPDDAFDRAYSQNVVMNIADKRRFYAEARRVLKPGAVIALSNLMAGPGGLPHFPVPWANGPDTSFLSTEAETRADIAAAGFEILSFRDTASETVPKQSAFRRKLESEGMPALGMQVLMGERMRELTINSIRSLEEGRAIPVEILLRKPA
ncbi:SAM-dependent methyltransferase [Allostella vacuolata]|nr:SAM-dependent methyltransferase [Stella vacuolata]